MQRRKLAVLAIGFAMAALLSGCGSSSHSPSSPLSVATSTLPPGVINVPYTTTLSATGGVSPYAWNVGSGSLPPGLSLSRAGVLSGTPTSAGGFGISVNVADSEQPPSVASAMLPISINSALQVTTTTLLNGSPSVFYSATLAASGGIAPYSWTITQGSLPIGLTLNATSGVISGTPTATGTSSFTVQASDSETPPATATASLSIAINPPPPRGAALYTSNNGPNYEFDGVGLQIQSDGSLTLLPSSPESAITEFNIAASPTLPLLFMAGENVQGPVQSLLVNPDYSLASYGSSTLPGFQQGNAGPPSVDPTGSNLYLPGPIDSSGTTGVTVLPANGSLQALGTIAVPNVTTNSRMVFTPDGTLAFIATCPSPSTNGGSILSFSRASDGTLILVATYPLAASDCAAAMAVSPDGKYLATSEVQIYSIASNGALTAVLPQPFTFTQEGVTLNVLDLLWDASGTYLIASPVHEDPISPLGGIAVLSFSGSAVTEIIPPMGQLVGRLQRTGSFVYAMGLCQRLCPASAIDGYDFQNAQLTPVPGSPYQYGNQGDMVIY